MFDNAPQSKQIKFHLNFNKRRRLLLRRFQYAKIWRRLFPTGAILMFVSHGIWPQSRNGSVNYYCMADKRGRHNRKSGDGRQRRIQKTSLGARSTGERSGHGARPPHQKKKEFFAWHGVHVLVNSGQHFFENQWETICIPQSKFWGTRLPSSPRDLRPWTWRSIMHEKV